MVYYIHTYKEGTALSKETKSAKKELKAQKKAAKLEKKQDAAYAKLVKSIEKKNAKSEKKANKKNKPFVPVAIPTREEAFANVKDSKGKNIAKLIVLLLLICYLIYFLVMWFTYVAPPIKAEEPEDSQSTPATYDRYENQHEITTVPDYTVAEAKALLKQVLKDNYKAMGYSADPSSSSINYTGSIKTVNNEDCYEFSASGKTFEVAINLSAVYQNSNGNFIPYTFHGTEHLEFQN